jgi:hypothetical protein
MMLRQLGDIRTGVCPETRVDDYAALPTQTLKRIIRDESHCTGAARPLTVATFAVACAATSRPLRRRVVPAAPAASLHSCTGQLYALTAAPVGPE